MTGYLHCHKNFASSPLSVAENFINSICRKYKEIIEPLDLQRLQLASFIHSNAAVIYAIRETLDKDNDDVVAKCEFPASTNAFDLDKKFRFVRP